MAKSDGPRAVVAPAFFGPADRICGAWSDRSDRASCVYESDHVGLHTWEADSWLDVDLGGSESDRCDEWIVVRAIEGTVEVEGMAYFTRLSRDQARRVAEAILSTASEGAEQ